MITTIIFDLSEVLLTGFWGIQYKLAPILAIDVKTVMEVIYGEDFYLLLNGKLTEHAFWEKILQENRWGVSPDELGALARANFTEIGGTRDIILRLGQKYRLGLLSNHAREWIDYCEETFAYRELFNACIYSFEVGMCKPDEGMYNLILNKMGEKAENCLFIDDMNENVISAKKMGFTTIQFMTPDGLLSELQKLQIG